MAAIDTQNNIESEIQDTIKMWGYSERFARAIHNPDMFDGEFEDIKNASNACVEAAVEYILAALEEPKCREILACRSNYYAELYSVISASNRFDLVDKIGAHPDHGYSNPDSEVLEGIFSNSMTFNQKMMDHIESKWHTISYRVFTSLKETFVNEIFDNKEEYNNGEYNPQYNMLQKYYQEGCVGDRILFGLKNSKKSQRN